jgi:hypothetical protein
MTRAAPLAPVVALALAACGGSSSSSKSTSATHTTTAASQPSGSASQITTGPVRGKLVGDNHSPKLKRNWFYTVTVTDASGHPLNGTVLTEFSFGGQVVGRETPPVHKLSGGRLHDRINFPPPSLGEPITVQTVVHTSKGSITLSWPVTPTK